MQFCQWNLVNYNFLLKSVWLMIIICLDDGLVPLPQPIQTNHQWGLVAFTCWQFHKMCSIYLSWIWVWILPISFKITAIFPSSPFLHQNELEMESRVGVTKALFANFSVSKIFDLAKVPVRFFESHSYLTGVTAATPAKYKRDVQ